MSLKLKGRKDKTLKELFQNLRKALLVRKQDQLTIEHFVEEQTFAEETLLIQPIHLGRIFLIALVEVSLFVDQNLKLCRLTLKSYMIAQTRMKKRMFLFQAKNQWLKKKIISFFDRLENYQIHSNLVQYFTQGGNEYQQVFKKIKKLIIQNDQIIFCIRKIKMQLRKKTRKIIESVNENYLDDSVPVDQDLFEKLYKNVLRLAMMSKNIQYRFQNTEETSCELFDKMDKIQTMIVERTLQCQDFLHHAKTFETFRVSARRNQTLIKNYEILKQKMSEGKKICAKFYKTKQKINTLKNNLQEIIRDSALQNIVDGNKSENPREAEIREQLMKTKKEYQEYSLKLKSLRQECEHIENLIQNNRKQLAKDFQTYAKFWFQKRQQTVANVDEMCNIN